MIRSLQMFIDNSIKSTFICQGFEVHFVKMLELKEVCIMQIYKILYKLCQRFSHTSISNSRSFLLLPDSFRHDFARMLNAG